VIEWDMDAATVIDPVDIEPGADVARSPVPGRRRRPAWWLEIILVAGFYAGYSAVRDAQGASAGKPSSFEAAKAHALQIVHAERVLGIYHERWAQHIACATSTSSRWPTSSTAAATSSSP